jgi:hypothetical protein
VKPCGQTACRKFRRYRLQLEQNKNIKAQQLRRTSMSDLVHDLVSFVSIGAFITTLALWLVAV